MGRGGRRAIPVRVTSWRPAPRRAEFESMLVRLLFMRLTYACAFK